MISCVIGTYVLVLDVSSVHMIGLPDMRITMVVRGHMIGSWGVGDL